MKTHNWKLEVAKASFGAHREARPAIRIIPPTTTRRGELQQIVGRKVGLCRELPRAYNQEDARLAIDTAEAMGFARRD